MQNLVAGFVGMNQTGFFEVGTWAIDTVGPRAAYGQLPALVNI